MKSYEINLDLPYQQRWKKVIEDHKHEIPELNRYINKLVNSLLPPRCFILLKIITWIVSWFVWPTYWYDVKAMSNLMGLDFYKAFWMQYMYEIAAGCTTVVFEHKEQTYLFRTMDWDLPLLQKLTIEINVYSQGRFLYTAVTWVGYAGIMTARSANGVTIVVNYRRTNERNLKKVLYSFLRRGWSVGALIRHTLENDSMNSATMLNRFCHSILHSPTYITMAHPDTGASCIITRDPTSFHLRRIENQKLIQTNHDALDLVPNENILWSIERLDACQIGCPRLIRSDEAEHDLQTLANHFLKGKIYNHETIYAYVANVTKRTHLTVIPPPTQDLEILQSLHYLLHKRN